jgi:hypothetical protein
MPLACEVVHTQSEGEAPPAKKGGSVNRTGKERILQHLDGPTGDLIATMVLQLHLLRS